MQLAPSWGGLQHTKAPGSVCYVACVLEEKAKVAVVALLLAFLSGLIASSAACRWLSLLFLVAGKGSFQRIQLQISICICLNILIQRGFGLFGFFFF